MVNNMFACVNIETLVFALMYFYYFNDKVTLVTWLLRADVPTTRKVTCVIL